MFFVFYRLLLVLSRGGNKELYLLPGERKAGNSGFPLVCGKGSDRDEKVVK